MSFDGKKVVVTGGTGALGAAVVERLLQAGATCFVPVRSTSSATGPGERRGLHVTPGIDVTSENDVRAYYEQLPSLWASIHCAGGFDMAPVTETSVDAFEHMMSINALTTFLCSREAVKKIRDTGAGGRIVNVAARPAVQPGTGAGMCAYTAGKGAVAAFTEALAEELAPEGIWVNAVAPSIIDTEANRSGMPDADFSRWLKPEEVAGVIVFLASSSGAGVRGSIVRVYGKA